MEDGSGNLVSGLSNAIGVDLRDEDGAAIEVPVISEQASSGFYEAHFTPTKGRNTGYAYLLRLRAPTPQTDGAHLEYSIRSFPSITISGVTGAFLTDLASVKELAGSTPVADDALLT